jgi:hypothetical protein
VAITNSERVNKTLLLVRDGIGPGCVAAWDAKYGRDWKTIVHDKERHSVGNPDVTDLAWLLKGMTNTWQEVWSSQFGPVERSYVSELRDARNKWAHQESFSTRDTLRILDTAERLLAAFSAGEQIKSVQVMHRELQRLQIEEETRSERRKVAAKPTEGQPMAGLRPWREVVTPHPDVATGRLQQAEFAADLYQVANGLADEEYLDPEKFFRRTFLTAGLQQLLVGAAERLSGSGGDPVIDLQTNFGGGKTHSMIALFHLASGVPVTKLTGVDVLLDEHKLELPKKMNRAVVAGQWLSPSIPSTKPDGTVVSTLWGEIAWQLCGKNGYSIIEEADKEGTNPGDSMIDVFKLAGPSIVLIDEWVAYARQLPARDGDARVIGGDFETQFTFAQTLTEAAAAVDNVVVLVSIPASDIEVGGEKGRNALDRLTNVVRRKSRQWKPADDDESFEIVRRRLFEPMTPEQERIRDGVIRSFMDYYREKPGDFGAQVQLPEYERRMRSSYPIHPELFDRLYQDWSTLDRFQRTRGVLRLMSSVISQLWMRDDRNLLIMPGTIPLDQSSVSSELSRYLDDGWDPIIRSDIDGANSLSLRLDEENKLLGRYSATRRVARAVFMATAPRGQGTNGVDLKTITLGVAQPGESPGTFNDALRRLSNDATYLYVDGAQYWFSARPNIIRTAAGIAASNFRADDADSEVRRRIQALRPLGPFKGVHTFPDGPGDVGDDDDGVRLVVLPMTATHVAGEDKSLALDAANGILAQRNAGPRLSRNLLVFLAAHEARVNELREGVYIYLAWQSILDKRDEMNLTPNDVKLAESKAKESSETVNQRILETFQFALVPQQEPGKREIIWHQSKPSGNGNLFERTARKLESEERLITSYGGTRVRMELDRIPLWKERGDISVADLWKAYCEFPYLTRLASIEVLNEAIGSGVANFSWATETFAYADAHDGTRWVGLVTAQHVAPRPSGLVVRPTEANIQINAVPTPSRPSGNEGAGGIGGNEDGGQPDENGDGGDDGGVKPQLKTKYYGQFTLDSVRAVRQLADILESIVDHLNSSGGNTTLTLELNSSSAGFDDRTQRVVKENAAQLGAKSQEFE